MRYASRRWVALWLLLLCAPRAWAGEPAALPSHPRLLLGAAGVAELKQRIGSARWAQAQWDEIKARVEKNLAQPVELPPRGGNWSHNYVRPVHGARLSLGKKIGPWQWEHTCPIGPHVLHGDPSKATLDFDGNAISSAHGANAGQVIDCGLLFQVTGERRYADRARDILTAYADRYLTYPLHDNQGKPRRGGHVHSQPLTEASWLIDICQGADLVWDTLSEPDRQRIADKLLRPALNEIILPSKLGIHNIQCRLNSAIGLVGFLLGDAKLIAKAIDDKDIGYRQQMERGVLADGMWLEGASGYHFFTIAGVWPLTEAARNCGLDLYGEKLKSMFDAPLTFARPDLVLPDFNDSTEVSLKSQADLYELGYARYHNPAYVPLLVAGKRQGRLALLFGAPELSTNAPTGKDGKEASPLASRNSTASGYAILQRGRDEQATWLCLKYGPHGGGHGHPDKDHFVLYARGQVIAPDSGTHAYGSPLHGGWDKTTLAHNTLVVDQTSQSPAQGKCLAFGSDHGVDYVMADAGPIYKDVRFIRTAALLNDNLLVFVDQVRADTPHTLDIVYHQFGQWDALVHNATWTPPNIAGYKFLKSATVLHTSNAWTLDTGQRIDLRPAITLAAGEWTEIITANGIRKTTEDLVPVVIFRRTAQQTAFVWAVSVDGAPVQLRVLPVREQAGGEVPTDQAVAVQVSSGQNHWALLVNPEQKAVTAPLPEGGEWRSAAPFAVR